MISQNNLKITRITLLKQQQMNEQRLSQNQKHKMKEKQETIRKQNKKAQYFYCALILWRFR
ncbi:hypothetical protein [Pedobacter chitinilyticus]|uniref:hypothetical protein n=1 Tax=Pedobacter chitinilyticus TaxID=2233776 RepID=UPI000DE49E0B|nr:hypothetical protein [Pedobacter chitinilyticus]